MNNIIKFEFLEPPRSKQRPRMGWNKKKQERVVYTPQPTRSYEDRLSFQVGQMMYLNGLRRFKKDISLECTIYAYYDIPASTSNAKRLLMKSGKILPTKKPDADNVQKIIFDALNGICYEDDSQICDVIFRKRYGTIPKISVTIKEIET